MKLRMKFVAVLALVCGMSVMAAPQFDLAKIAMEAARKKAEIDGDLDAAIKQYKDIASKYKTQHPIAAEALLHAAELNEKQKNAEARKLYEQIVKDFGDQRQIAATAQAHLTALAGVSSGGVAKGRTQIVTHGNWETVTPDGRYLIGSGEDFDMLDLWSGKEVQWWKDDADRESFAFSRDGKQVAYTYCGNGPDGRCELRTATFAVPMIGPEKVIVSKEEYDYYEPFGWSPDRKEVLAVLYRTDNKASLIAAISAADGTIRTLKTMVLREPEGVSLSPDGKTIAFDYPVSENTTNRDIFLMATDGSGEVPIVTDTSRDTAPIWTPDGKVVVFLSDRSGTMGLWKVPVAQGKAVGSVEPVRLNIGRLQYVGTSNDGTFYYQTGPSRSSIDVFTAEIDLTGGTVTRPESLAVERFAGHNSASAYSPDGKKMAYFSQRSASGEFVSIVIRTLATGEEIEVPTVFQNPTAPVWFPDGGSLLFAARNEGLESASLHRVDLKTGTDLIRQKIVGDFPAISPDGKTIYFVRNGESRLDVSIRSYDLENQKETELFKGDIPRGQGQHRLSVSPDGRQIAFTSTVEPVPSLTSPNPTPNSTVINLVAAQGGSTKRLSSPASQQIRAIQWSADGKSVLAQRGNGQLWWVPADGGEAKRIGTETFPMIDAMHPDGKQIALTKSTRDANAVRDRELWRDPDLLNPKPAVSSENGIYIASINAVNGKVTGPAVRFTETSGDCAPSWSPDGKSIAFKRPVANSNGQTQMNWVVRSLDSRSEKVFPVNLPYCWNAPVWFHDGKSLLNGSFLEQQNRQPFRMDLDTGQPVNLQFPTYKPAMTLSPDDKTLYLTVVDQKDKTTGIVSVDLASGDQKKIWTSPIAADTTSLVPLRLALSPDGRTFALVLSESKKSHLIRVGIDGSGYREIYSVDGGGASGDEISRSGLAWTKDGRSILFMNWDTNKSQHLMRITAEGSAKPEFTGLEIPSTDEIFDLSPDGKRIVFFSPRLPTITGK